MSVFRKIPFIRKLYILHDNILIILRSIERIESSISTLIVKLDSAMMRQEESNIHYSSVNGAIKQIRDDVALLNACTGIMNKRDIDADIAVQRIDHEMMEVVNIGVIMQRQLEETRNIVCNKYYASNSNNGEIYASNVEKEMWLLAGKTSAEFAIRHLAKIKTFDNAFNLLSHSIQNCCEGIFLEFGVFSGNTINYISSLAPDKKIYGFDSFNGLPEDWRNGFGKGCFFSKDLPKVNNNVQLVKGWFEDTLPTFFDANNDVVSFIHIDCDLYSSTKTVFDHLKNIVDGTIIVFDEFFNYPSWEQNEARAFWEFIESSCWKYEFIGYVPSHQQVAVRLKA